MGSTTDAGVSWPELRARRTIVVVDVVESVRLMQAHEAEFIARWRRFVDEMRTRVLPQYGGRLVKSLGDGMLLEFAETPPALAAALEAQRVIARCSEGFSDGEQLCLRIGAHLADVLVDELDVYGSGVNLAARIMALAQPSQIVISAEARDALVPSLDGEVHDLGECYVKHLTTPVRCFSIEEPQHHPPILPLLSNDAFIGPAIAVMPLDHGGGDLIAGLGEALAGEVASVLSRSRRIRVISQLSTRAVASRGMLCDEIGKRLGARYVLSGTLAAVSGTATVVTELSDVVSGNVLWSEVLQPALAALFDPDSGHVGAIVAGIMDAIDHAEVEKARMLPLPTLQSYTLMIAGVTMMHRTAGADFARARLILEHLLERSGRHPLPRAWLAKWHVLNVQQGWSADPASDARAALDHTARAMEADPACHLAHTIEGFVRANVLRDFDRAGACYTRALDLNPNDALAWLLSGMLHAFRDEGQAAVQACEHAQGLSPLDPLRYFFDALSASAALTAGQYERAVLLARRSLQLNRSHLSTHRALTAALALAGRTDEARTCAAELLARDPGFTVSQFLDRTPGRAFGISTRIAHALRDAGIPA
ncbi:adenylate/guanylate cyclase domain-containing protein [Variovorax sp. J31P207]|uniref:adenylate/guanylate cyclase domain-containing protein n=1 Tax=Variovorax sp. J31P207 TaxID=3053510 RepID=UPI0025781C9B|nr:adenylate/guanylate cyclase domain-containing protein [Variovorax sp. J31P207]MDM0064984.1 adenylate/guanylate cyclase domain-containing protein [Variovorax sp. J31P207]